MTQLCSVTPVPYEGPEKYNMLLVGEAPGEVEVGQGRPFVGQAGELLRRYLARKDCLGPEIGDVKFANLCKHRPMIGNQFKTILKTRELEQGLEDLQEEINRVKPNVIVALGGWPMYYLTGLCGSKNGKPIAGTGITLYRGSIVQATSAYGSGKVVCSFHPSYVNRDWKWNPVFYFDLCRAAKERLYPDLLYTPYEEHIDPPDDLLDQLVEETIASEWASCDIETFPGGRYSCVGWGYKRPSGSLAGVCITYKSPEKRRFARAMWESEVPKIFQYGTYDTQFMRHFYGWNVGGYYGGRGFDTYVAAASLLPDFPRGLDFLASIHSRFPYYKTDRKVWREKGDLNILWRYNLKDCIATYEIAMDQLKQLRELYPNWTEGMYGLAKAS